MKLHDSRGWQKKSDCSLQIVAAILSAIRQCETSEILLLFACGEMEPIREERQRLQVWAKAATCGQIKKGR